MLITCSMQLMDSAHPPSSKVFSDKYNSLFVPILLFIISCKSSYVKMHPWIFSLVTKGNIRKYGIFNEVHFLGQSLNSTPAL